MSSPSNEFIQIGDFFTITYSDLPSKSYTIFHISSNRIIGYNPLDMNDQLTLTYDNINDEWTPSPEIIDDITKITFVENPLTQDLNGIGLIDVVKLLPNKIWDYRYLSKNPNITLEDVLKNPDLDWNYVGLSGNPNITLHDVLEHPELPWSYAMLSSNPNITFQDVLE